MTTTSARRVRLAVAVTVVFSLCSYGCKDDNDVEPAGDKTSAAGVKQSFQIVEATIDDIHAVQLTKPN